MQHQLVCWRCGQPLAALSLPLSRMDECPACAISLHVCKMCQHYDRSIAEQCRHDEAEYVKEKERPNFCDYFAPSESAYEADDGGAAARQQLDQLFEGGDDAGPQDSASALDDLFRKD